MEYKSDFEMAVAHDLTCDDCHYLELSEKYRARSCSKVMQYESFEHTESQVPDDFLCNRFQIEVSKLEYVKERCCVGCGVKGDHVKWLVDPYQEEINGKIVTLKLCPKCYSDSLADI